MLVFALSWWGAAAADVAPEDLAIGATGTARTAGPGDRIETFPITILGVLDDAGVGFPLILIRAEGPFIERSGGVAAGMSGSPVYVDVDGVSELIGAIGFVFPESDHALALVTPIAAMRRVADAVTGAQRGSGDAKLPTSSAQSTVGDVAARDLHVPGLGRAVPVATPILIGGIGRRAQRLLEPAFGPDALVVNAQGGLEGSRKGAFTLEPGSAISVQFARGDVTIGAIGTLTLLESGRVLALGHALLSSGPSELPFSPAYVQAIVGSDVVPFKLANSGTELLGTFTQDRPAGLAGRAGALPDLLPTSVVLSGVGGGESLSFDVVRDPRLVPALVASAVLEGIDRSLQATGSGSARLAWEIHLRDGPPIRILDHVADERDVAFETALAILRPLQALTDNPFADPDIARLAVNVELTWSLEVADVVEVRSEVDAVRPGDKAIVHVRLQPYRQEPQVETFLIELPADLPDDGVRLRIRGGRERPEEPDVDDGEPPLLSFAELSAALSDRPAGNDLVVELVTDTGVERLARRPFPFVVRGIEEVHLERLPDATPSEDDVAGGGATGGVDDTEGADGDEP